MMGRQTTSPTDSVADRGTWWRSFPYAYRTLRVWNDSRPIGFRFSPYIVNIEAEFQEANLLTCGEAETAELASTKAISELIERTVMKQWTGRNPDACIKSSSGWAAHESFEDARMNAIFELAERDAILAQWYSATPFLQISNESLPAKFREWASNELAQSEFPLLKILISTQGLGSSAVCILMNEHGFGISGHGAKPNLQESIESAIAEACRAGHHYLRRSFWKDSIDLKRGIHSSQIQPGTHSVYYAYHEPFPTWMFGAAVSWRVAEARWNAQTRHFIQSEVPRFKFNLITEDPLFVGYASHPECFEVSWGPTNVSTVQSKSACKRFASLITKRSLNCKPHIVS